MYGAVTPVLIDKWRPPTADAVWVDGRVYLRQILQAFPFSPLLLPRFYFFALLFTSHCSPLSERLEQTNPRSAKRTLQVGFCQTYGFFNQTPRFPWAPFDGKRRSLWHILCWGQSLHTSDRNICSFSQFCKTNCTHSLIRTIEARASFAQQIIALTALLKRFHEDNSIMSGLFSQNNLLLCGIQGNNRLLAKC